MALSERTTQRPPEWDSERLKESAEKRASSRPAPLCFSPGLWSLRRDCCHIFHLHRFGLMIQITVWEINVRTLKRAPLLVRVHGVPAHTERHMVVFNLRPDSKILRIKNSWLESMGYEIPPLHLHGQLKRNIELCFPASCIVAMLCKLQNVSTYDWFFFLRLFNYPNLNNIHLLLSKTWCKLCLLAHTDEVLTRFSARLHHQSHMPPSWGNAIVPL